MTKYLLLVSELQLQSLSSSPEEQRTINDCLAVVLLIARYMNIKAIQICGTIHDIVICSRRSNILFLLASGITYLKLPTRYA